MQHCQGATSNGEHRGSKVWVPLIGVTGYISYAPALVTRQLGGMQYRPITRGLADFIGLFKHQSFLEEMELIRQDWKKPLMVKREEGSSFETSFSQNYTVWRNKELSENGLTQKELAKVKRSTKGKMSVDKEMMDSLKKGRSILLKKVEVEKEKNRLAHLDIEEERRIIAQYMMQLEEERSSRKAAESDMRDYQKRAESSKGRMMALQSEIEIREEELKEMRSHYFEMEEELSKAKQERQECQDYIDSFTVQINSKIAELDLEKEELQRVRDKLARSEDMVRVLERSNEALGASNEVIIADNTVFHDKIRHITKQVEQAACYAERLQQ
ncbi:uncharacterized protein LOC133689466 [Populus nigra]|uniref:uncharacterized protein LOC133689466 n=1 Tax=Populus nigra TaxID=3691 RepID=UPI002B273190|nr:uncharacterized protein LOC133689466 [Populus nigra]